MALNLKHIKLEKQDAKAWHVRNEKTGEKFSVPKAGLSAETHGRIAQHFDEGGQVQPEAAAPSDQQAAWDLTNSNNMAQGAGAVNPSVSDANTPLPFQVPQQPVDPAAAQAAQDKYQASLDEQAAHDKETQAAHNERLARESEDATSGEVVSAPAPMAQGASGSVAPAAAPARAPGMPGVGAGGPADIDKSLQGDISAEKQAAMEEARVKQQAADASSAIQQEALAKQQTLATQTQSAYKANTERIQGMMRDIASSKVNPTEFWDNKSLGEKAVGLVSLMAGGFYAGFTGRANPVQAMFDKTIEQNIEAQKANITSKQNAVRMYMEQGHDILEAGKLATADQMQITSAQLAASATKFAGPLAMAQAQSTAAEYDQKGQALRQQVYTERLHAQSALIDMAAKRQQMGLASQAGAIQQQQAQVLNAARNGTLRPADEVALPKDIQERMVHFREEKTSKSGEPVQVATSRIATSADAAKEATKALKKNGELATTARDLAGLVKDAGSTGLWDANKKQKAKTLMGHLNLSFLGGEEGLSRLTDGEREIMSQMFGNPESFWGSATGKNKTAIDTLQKMIRNSRQSTLDAYTIPSDAGGADDSLSPEMAGFAKAKGKK